VGEDAQPDASIPDALAAVQADSVSSLRGKPPGESTEPAVLRGHHERPAIDSRP